MAGILMSIYPCGESLRIQGRCGKNWGPNNENCSLTLQNFFLSGPSRQASGPAVPEAINKLVAARQLSGHPIAVFQEVEDRYWIQHENPLSASRHSHAHVRLYFVFLPSPTMIEHSRLKKKTLATTGSS